MKPPAAPTRATAPPPAAVRVHRLAGSPVISVRVLLRGGARCEEIPGQALVTGRMLAEGSARRSFRQIALDAEGRGADLSSSGGQDAIGVAIDALSRDWERALDWAAEIALEPAFAADRADWVTRHAAAELASLADHPEVRTEWAFREQLYRPHPAGRPLQGDPKSLARLGPGDCRLFHRRSLAAGVIVAVAGEVDEEAVAGRLERLFPAAGDAAGSHREPPRPRGGGRRRQVALGAAGDHPAPAGGRVEQVEQAHLFVGRLGVERRDPAHDVRRLLAVALGSGAGLHGRLPSRLRERDGLAYLVHVAGNAGAGLDPGRFEVYVAVSPKDAGRAQAAIEEELARAASEGISREEIEEARTYLLGREPFRRQSARQWAELLAAAELYGLPLERPGWTAERLAAVDGATLGREAGRLLEPSGLKVTLGLPEAPSPDRLARNRS